MMSTPVILISLSLVLVVLAIVLSKKQEGYAKFCAKSKQPRFLGRSGLVGGLCIGAINNKSGDPITFTNYRDADDFDTSEGQLRSKVNRNSVAAYYNANADGNPLEYTNVWTGQKFAFDVQGFEDGRQFGTIRHVESGRCLHPENGYPENSGQRLVTWGDCTPQNRIMYSAY